MEDINNFFKFTMSQALLAIQNILQNSNIFIGSRETVLITPFGKKKVTQFSGLPPTSVSYLNSSMLPNISPLTIKLWTGQTNKLPNLFI